MMDEERMPGPEEEWPASGLQYLSECPVCGQRGRSLLHKGLTDRIFFCAPGSWDMYQCDTCESAFLNEETPYAASSPYSASKGQLILITGALIPGLAGKGLFIAITQLAFVAIAWISILPIGDRMAIGRQLKKVTSSKITR